MDKINEVKIGMASYHFAALKSVHAPWFDYRF